MYFLKRGDQYIDVSGKSFRDHFNGKLIPGERATISDWANHISTIFPEVRLKRYIEMRGSDNGAWEQVPALPAFWVGLLYDDVSLDAAWRLVKDWSAEERQKARDEVPRLGLKAKVRGRTLQEIAADCLALARAGLKRRNRLDRDGRDEGRHLEPLEQIVAAGQTPAELLLAKYHGPWGGSVEPAYRENRF
jgi:glutamate--cysteine ligase